MALLPLDAGHVEKISYLDKLPNEILQKILTEALLFSGFSWPSHVCQTYNVLKNVSVCFCHVTSRLAWALPSIHFATGGKAGKVGVKTLLCKFGPASGVMIEVKKVLACRYWKNAYLKLQFCRQGWLVTAECKSASCALVSAHGLKNEVYHNVQLLVCCL